MSVLATDREIRGGGHNRVVGPDFQWRPSEKDTVTGQLLYSDSRTPVRPDLADEWDGRALTGHGAVAWWPHSTKTIDWFGQYKDFGDEFRADNGFVPQVGYRADLSARPATPSGPPASCAACGPSSSPTTPTDREGDLLNRQVSFGTGMDGKWSSFLRFWYAFDRVRAGEMHAAPAAAPLHRPGQPVAAGRTGSASTASSGRRSTSRAPAPAPAPT